MASTLAFVIETLQAGETARPTLRFSVSSKSGGPMRFSKTGRRGVALMAFVAATTLFAAGCSAGSLGSSSGGQGSAGGTTITWLVGSDDNTTRMVKEVVTAFQAANPGITVKTEPRPGGSDGDNLVKTRSTGEMAEVFTYNNGSLLSALKPAQNLTPMD